MKTFNFGMIGVEVDSSNNWMIQANASGAFQIWAEKVGIGNEESLAYILYAQGRLGEYGTSPSQVREAAKVLGPQRCQTYYINSRVYKSPSGFLVVRENIQFFLSETGEFFRFSCPSEIKYLTEEVELPEVVGPVFCYTFQPQLWDEEASFTIADYSACKDGFIGSNNGAYAFYQKVQIFHQPATGKLRGILRHSNSSDWTTDDDGYYAEHIEGMLVCGCQNLDGSSVYFYVAAEDDRELSIGFEKISTPLEEILIGVEKIQVLENGHIEVVQENGLKIEFHSWRDLLPLYKPEDTGWE